MNSLIELLKEQWLKYLELQGKKSSKTIISYKRFLESFIDLTNIENPKQITEELINEFVKKLKRKKVSNFTIFYYLVVLRDFLRFLMIEKDLEVLTPNAIVLPRVKHKKEEVIEKQAINKILKLIKKQKKTLKNLRDRIIIEILYLTGIKVSELCSLNKNSIDFENNILIVGSGRKKREFKIPEYLKNIIKEFLQKREDFDNALIINTKFKNKENLRLSIRQIERILNYWSKKSGLKKSIKPKDLRYLYIKNLILKEDDERFIEKLTGFSSFSSAKSYYKIYKINEK